MANRHRMTARIAAVLLMAVSVAACSGDDADESTTTDAPTTTSVEATTSTASAETTSTIQRQPEGASAFFSIDEVVLGPEGYVTLNNFTDVAVTLGGLHLCQGPTCFALPDEAVESGGNAYVAVGEAPDVDGTIVIGATIGALRPPDGELALYVTDPDDPEKLVAYMQWGSTPHDRTEQAIAKGLWLEGSYAPSGDNAVRLYRDLDSGLWLWDAA